MFYLKPLRHTAAHTLNKKSDHFLLVGEMGARLNVSHAGHLTVLAAEMTAQQSEVTGDEAGRIGVDIMPVTDR